MWCTFQACKQLCRCLAHLPAAMSAILAAKSMRLRRGAADAAQQDGQAGAAPAPMPGSRRSDRSILKSFVVRLDSKGRRNANDVRKVRDAILHGERCAQARKQFIGTWNATFVVACCMSGQHCIAIGMSTLSCVVNQHFNAQIMDYVKDKKEYHRIKTVTHLRRAFKEGTCQFDRQLQGRWRPFTRGWTLDDLFGVVHGAGQGVWWRGERSMDSCQQNL